MTSKHPTLISIKSRNSNIINNKTFITPHDAINTIAPTSGSEPKYEPNKWNNNNKIKNNNNCYSYSLNSYSIKKDKPQPGYFANFSSLRESDYKCPTFLLRLKKDNPTLYVERFNKPCKKTYHKAFIAIDNSGDPDYHFYRQDSNGYWSHKPGRQDVINVDADDKLIINPLTSNRNFQNYNYKIPCFFFCVNSKFTRSHSSHSRHRFDLF